uniref:U4-theraphotoxin-Cg1a n=1 Tax=Chilobrachys guangxiensis TaxID=278060 RepID=JZ50C_CHIGU|nr:RecName: Full=U4-theraphotoxin-Cg1a; Short=U4-TRTX-Cg1a; AltName: Full=Jingzhaotoxin-50.3; Short=JZTX-50.3; AltName: Full=Peptide F7-7.25; Flags: Precursor [Chilobrachys guangxiensis]ABY71661.1 cystine knot toxin [Chilobrachys guangxiensis]
MNATIFALLLLLNLAMHNAAEQSSETDMDDTLLIPEINRGRCIEEGKWCPKKAPCCGRLECKGPSPKQKKCTRP